MAKTGAVWGIDIGHCALKALRCRPHESDAGRIVVEAFDYVEYPKLLSQPDADREELVREAVETFLSRNELKGDRVAISVSGQQGLARFIKLPPVESKKIPDIVKYEARQQIPFALEDVVWDYEPLAGGSQEEGFALETEIGLFAMKRDQVTRALEPLVAAKVEVDFIQLAPLAVYNYTCFDRLGELDDEEFDPANQPPSTVVLSMGVDTTDLVVTNGFRVWQRNIPIGGSHFTKALTKELKLTFGKAEHLKRNAAQAEDPRTVFKAMRPVFSDLVAEIQRSIGFFTSNNRGAELKEVVALGNAMKLPGLQRYLSENLEIPVKPIEEFEALVGGSVTSTPAFEENRLSFPVAYGLCVQALGHSRLSTNLLPNEIVTRRIIKAKKPWAAAAAAMVMIGMAANYSTYVSAWQTVDVDNEWKQPIGQSKSEAQRVRQFETANTDLKSKFEQIAAIGENLQSNVDGRLLWLELLKAVDAAMPRDERPAEERERTAEDVTGREEVHITSMDCQEFPDLSVWFSPVQKFYEESKQTAEARTAARRAAEEAAAVPAEGEEGAEEEQPEDGEAIAADEQPPLDDGSGDPSAEEADAGPTGEGWVIQLTGYHFHNNGVDNVTVDDEGAEFLQSTLIRNLEEGGIMLPDGPGGQMIEVSFEELGIGYPVVVTENKIETVEYDPEAADGEQPGRARQVMGGMAEGIGGRRRPGAARDDEPDEPEIWELRRYDFIVQFVWKPTPRHERQRNRSEAASEDTFAAN